ncbi:MAG TPA: reverse transcriptase family protein [Acetobacteraceae bacterium]|nr:reverse transcriptase family protein [Acetobacteraceae bacterium]
MSPFFLFSKVEELVEALGLAPGDPETEQIHALSERRLPPVSSKHGLATMLGVNPGVVWSLANRPQRYYRTFDIPKGRGTRRITAPRVALKIIQKWLGFHLARAIPSPPHVYGFVPGRSHIGAAYVHRGAEWAISVDIASFFQTTPAALVWKTLKQLGYDEPAAGLLTSLTCYHGFLAQGAPSSPALSNLCFAETDAMLVRLSERHACRITRYADDIVLSGQGSMPAELRDELRRVFEATPWQLAPEKESVQPLKGRIKIYGLVVRGPRVRTTKGYRNKLRAYAHILSTRGEGATDRRVLIGHVQYAQHVEATLERLARDEAREISEQ